MIATTTERHEMLLTVPEAAQRLRTSYATTLSLIHRGQLPAAKVGRAYRVRAEALDEALRRLEAATTTEDDREEGASHEAPFARFLR